MRHRPAYVALALICLAAGCHRPRPPARTLLPTGGVDVPIRSRDGQPVVDVLVNGKGPYPFMLDTGTTRVCVVPALAKELELPRGAYGARARTANGKVIHVDTTRLDSLSIGDARFEGVEALVVPPLRPGYVGLLGMRLFADAVLTVRFPSQRLLLSSRRLSASDPDTVPARFYKHTPTVPVSPPVRGPRWTPYVMLDTGMNSGLHLPASERRRLLTDPDLHGRLQIVTAGGVQTLEVVRLKGPLALGPYDFDDAAVALEPGRGRGRLGTLALRCFDVTIDTRSSRVRLFLPDPAPTTRQTPDG